MEKKGLRFEDIEHNFAFFLKDQPKQNKPNTPKLTPSRGRVSKDKEFAIKDKTTQVKRRLKHIQIPSSNGVFHFELS